MGIKKQTNQYVIKGFPICSGIAIAPAFFFTVVEEHVPEFAVPKDKIEAEVARYYRALKHSRRDLLALQKRLKAEGGNEAVAILHSHLEIMRDPLMTTDVEKAIREKGKNTEYIFKSVIGEYSKKLSKITDSFFQERVKDFQDISRRIIAHLQRQQPQTLAKISRRSIVFAHELSPSDTAEANTEFIEAFVTRSGSETSHVAIMARAKGIPFISKVDFPQFEIDEHSFVIVDGQTGDVILNPLPETLDYYKKEQRKLTKVARGLCKLVHLQAQTVDGHRVRVSANMESFHEIESLQKYGGEGVGLFRSEYLFLARDAFPSEEEQFVAYKSIVEKVHGGYPTVIRTFDIGGDKLSNFYPTRYEKNPYLGCRAIRLMLKEKKAFEAQIRAILRASAFGDIAILFPMISGVLELREVKVLLHAVKQELKRHEIPFNEKIPIGCMIEVPSAALTIDLLLKECDFVSIGTNDLVQYTLAVDRSNPSMSELYNPADPSILRMIRMVTQEGKKVGKSVSICGEIAANPRFTSLLLGLGVQELSLAAPAIPIIRNLIRRISIAEANKLADRALSLTTFSEVDALLETAYQSLQEN